jgi:hypothetical protein
MILEPNQPILDILASAVAQIVVVHDRVAGKIKRSTAMMKLQKKPKGTVVEQGMPTYWYPTEDGRIELYPAPNFNYEIELMGASGKPLGGSRQPVAVPPVEAITAAVNQVWDQQQRDNAQPVRIERFSLLGDE